MSDEQKNVDAGNETSGETTETVQTETAGVSETVETATETQNAGSAVEQKVGDSCDCPDGRPGTLHAGDQEGTFVCIPNQG
jgi:hypothetical protein